jgi:plasmid stabilization system protein ParE
VKIRYLRVARRELDAQIDYLLERNPRVADTLDRAITQALEDLAAGRLEGSEHRLRASGRRVRRSARDSTRVHRRGPHFPRAHPRVARHGACIARHALHS